MKVMYSIFPALEAPSQALKPCILTIVWIGLHSADSQILTEERHGGVLRVRTLGGHGAACWLALFRSQSCALLSQGPLETVAGTRGPPRSQSQNRPGPPTTWPGRSGGAETEDYRAVPDPGAEPAPTSRQGSVWGLRGVIGSLDLRSTPWVLLTEASSALPTPRLGAWTLRPVWSRPQGTLLPLQPPDRARKEGGAWR